MAQQHILRKHQRGAIAIIVGLSLVVLVGFAGLALDLGRLYVNKTELQNAADACALAASRELTCSTAPCPASNLTNAQDAGIYVAGLDLRDFQSQAVNIAPADVRFSTVLAPNSSYVSIAGGADPASKYVMCIARSTGIVPWFMGVLGIGAQDVSATAVATLAPAQTNCGIPMALCSKGPATGSPPYGLNVGQWYGGLQDSANGATGNFNWVDFTPPQGGAVELKNLLLGNGICNMSVTNPVGQTGMAQGAITAFNSRFGLYKNGGGNPQATEAPPDYTGYAYTSAANGNPTYSWPAGSNAMSDFLVKRSTHDPYGAINSPPNPSGLKFPGHTSAPASTLASLGADRRMVTSPIVDCTGWAGGSTTTPILAWACVLLLHPIEGPTNPVWFEYRGLSSDPGSPCATSGTVGGPGSVGPQVPALVQ